mgnify:CR=1 FL=1
MLGINCLIDNSSILPQLKETVEYVGYKVLEGGNKATIENVYNTMRKLGIEVDMQTVSHIYQEVFDSNDELFSTREEVESAREDIFRRIAEKKVVTGKQQIGRDNPSTTVSGSIASMLQDLGKRSPSAQKELEQGLKKVATKIMAQNPDSFPKAEREVETVEEILNRVFRSEEGQAMTVNEVEGKMNTAKELFEQFKEDIATLADEMAKKDAIGADKLMQFANIIQQSGYDLFLSQKEVKRVIDEALSDAGFTKEVTDKEGNKKTVTDWNKVISSNIDFKESLRTALKAKGFSDAQISSITPSLVREYQTLRGEKLKTKLQSEMNKRDSEAGMKRTVNETLRDAGFYKEITNKDDTTKLATDWNKVIGTDLKSITETLTSNLKAKGFSDAQINSILKVFNSLRDEKIKTKLDPKEPKARVVERVTDMDKLVAFNNMGIFKQENKSQLHKLLGVSQLDETSIAAIEKISSLLKDIDTRSKLSTTFMRQMNVLIEIELNKIQDTGLILKLVDFYSTYSQFTAGLTISNSLNVAENATSGLGQTMYTLATDPKNGMRYLRGALNVMGDVLQGGVREGVNYSDAFSANVNISDKYNPGTAKDFKSYVWTVANTLSRTFLETFDSGAKAAMVNNLFANSIKKIFMKQGMSEDEANVIINETLYGNNKEIDELADTLTKTLEAAGLRVLAPGVKSKRIANELRRTNIKTDGAFFQSVIEDLVAKKIISEKAKDLKIDEKVFNGVLNAAEATAGKGLGHVSDNWLFQLIYDKPSKYLSRKLSEARKGGNKNTIAGQMLTNVGAAKLTMYLAGSARWTWLNFQKLSGIALAQTIITDIVFSEGVIDLNKKTFNKELVAKYLRFSKLSDDFDLEYKDGKPVREDGKSQGEYELEKYLSLRERLKREFMGPFVGYALSQTVLPVLAKLLGFGYDDDDTEEEKLNKMGNMAYWLYKPEQRDLKRTIDKIGFVHQMAYMGTIIRKDKYGQPFYIHPKDPNPKLYETYYNMDVLNMLFVENYNKGGSFNIMKALEDENEKRGGSTGRVLTKFATELSGLGAPFKFYDMQKAAWNGLNGLKSGGEGYKTENQPKAETIPEQIIKSTVTRDMYRKYKEGKD